MGWLHVAAVKFSSKEQWKVGKHKTKNINKKRKNTCGGFFLIEIYTHTYMSLCVFCC